MKSNPIIFSVNRSHNASACLMIGSEVIFNLEAERLSNIKYDLSPYLLIPLLKKYVDHIDYLCISGTEKIEKLPNLSNRDIISDMVYFLNKTFYNKGFQLYDFGDMHHTTHAASSFYNSGFDNAMCIVKDGSGSFIDVGGYMAREIYSVYNASYPSNFEPLYKLYQAPFITNGIIKYKDIYLTDSISEGIAFELASVALGFSINDAGKTMGLAAYGKPNKNIPPIYKDSSYNNEIFAIKDNYPNIVYEIDNKFETKADFAFALQKQTEKKVLEEVLEAINKFNPKNICFSGGFFLNCSSNFNLAQNIPSDINIYVEPMSSDAGTAMGAAKMLYYQLSGEKEKIKQTNVYYGPKHSVEISSYLNKKECSYSEVAKLISEKNIVAIYQGGSESGPRALGNRSILYDPRDMNGKNVVNSVKKRESFRPFAGSVMSEFAKDWFDLGQLKDSDFMMFAVNVKKEKADKIPAITHIDGTCRVQTVKKENNIHFYNLINEFYLITGVPILFNTSFNLAGDAIVETPQDAIRTFLNSSIDYLYFPENGYILYK